MFNRLTFVHTGTEDGSNITVFVPGRDPQVAHSTHPNFDRIMAGAIAGDESVLDLFDVARTVSARFEPLTERVSVANGRVYFDGDEVHSSLTRQIVRVLDEGGDFDPLVNFFDNVQQNPNEHSREQLFEWLDRRDFTITPDGMIVGYKSVYADGDGFRSVHGGKAIVNGQVQQGRITQDIGDVVEMPRSEVEWNPAVGCHRGLHVGSWDYAESFSGDTVLEIHVNPRDVVSVPTDCDAAKVRCCRYVVVDVLEKPYSQAVVSTPYQYDRVSESFAWGEDDDDECPECGSYLPGGTDYCDYCDEYV